MDPTICHYEMVEAMVDDNLSVAKERAISLKEWLDKGGYPPIGYRRKTIEDYILFVFRKTQSLGELQ